ncbi:hypothetical protein BDW62DRAFT_206010 [Aspergillus aurantiobrunneus]
MPTSPPTATPFHLSPATLPNDWDSLFTTYWKAWSEPLQAVSELTLPHIGTGTPVEQASFQRLKKNYLEDALKNPDRIHWVKCVDRRTGEIIGGACYETYFGNPYRAGREGVGLSDVNFLDRHVNATTGANTATNQSGEERGEEVGGRRRRKGGEEMQGAVDGGRGSDSQTELGELSGVMYSQFLDWRVRLMSDAHILGTALFILPAYRSQGAAHAIMEHLVARWDELNLEAYMEGTEFSTPIVRRYGFVHVAKHELGSTMRAYAKKRREDKPGWGQNAKVDATIEAIDEVSVTILWRPKKGLYVEGVTVLPWEGAPRGQKL